LPEEVKPVNENPAVETAPAVQAAVVPAKQSDCFLGTGRRKTSVARVRIRPGAGAYRVNGLEMKEYFRTDRLRQMALAALAVTNTAAKLDVSVNVRGGGPVGQAGATMLGVARSLIQMDATAFGPALRAQGFLTRDARKVERKKYGRSGARRSFQFSKR
jgi:small subunit ribosomal protein S9